jgi:hypothetical protein
MREIVRLLLALAAIVCLTLWIPTATVAWLPGWHEFHCERLVRCHEQYGLERAQPRIDELRVFLRHGSNGLPAEHWTAKERTHLAEVRVLLDRWTVFAALALLVLLHEPAARRARAARIAMLGIAACVVVLPFFTSFWREVFHPLLFDNDLWRNTPADTSFWIMPRDYFRYTVALVIGSAVLLTALLRWHGGRAPDAK